MKKEVIKEEKHSSLPWTFRTVEGIRDAEDKPIDIQLSARFVVKACNAYTALVDALKTAQKHLNEIEYGDTWGKQLAIASRVEEKINIALKLVE